MEDNKNNLKSIVGAGLVVVLVVIALVLFVGSRDKEDSMTYEPVTYSEVFEVPIDPNTEPERHVEVYKTVSERTTFEVFVPNYIPDGYELVEQETVGPSESYDMGSFRGLYKNGTKVLRLEQLLGDPMPGPDIEVRKIKLKNGIVARGYTYYPEGVETNTLWWVSNVDPYYVYSVTSTLPEQEVVKILNSMQEV